MPDWTSLPYDNVCNIGECLLSNNDIDNYMALRAVCHDWRSATKDYPEKGDYTDPHYFKPSKWALLDLCDDLITLVNIDTGRFLHKSMPLLRGFFFVGATCGGLILLGESTKPHQACVLNPFTGSIVHLKASIPDVGVRAVAMTTKPLMVFVSTKNCDILWADQNNKYFEQFWTNYPYKPTCMVSFAENVYVTDLCGSIHSLTVADVVVGEQRHKCSALTISMETIFPSIGDTSHQGLTEGGRYYLMKSGEDLLLVAKPLYFTLDQPVVRRVDIEKKVLEPVSTIGKRALFVSHAKGLSVNADKFQGILGGCIHFIEPMLTRGNFEPSKVTIFHVADRRIMVEWDALEGCFRPFTLAQVFTDYCRPIHYSELYHMMANEWGYSDDGFESDEDSSSQLDDESSSSELGDESSSNEPND
ncbi:uncharacterized protein [Aegilops tauschii subsp. strangulata]|nr:uncharacterized protein LOC109743712 [Aegilops tauschii subsp. strangulata]